MVLDKIRHTWAIVSRDPETARFIAVGAVGFFVNFALLWLFHGMGHLSLLTSQLVAAEFAIILNFIIHTRWTYRSYQRQPLPRRLALYHASAWAGAGINLVLLIVFAGWLHIYYLLALTLGAGVALVWNFAANRFWVWRKATAKTLERAGA
jgi:dolichol-phosphate mannosyltransferase